MEWLCLRKYKDKGAEQVMKQGPINDQDTKEQSGLSGLRLGQSVQNHLEKNRENLVI